jgi:hypothetical protein
MPTAAAAFKFHSARDIPGEITEQTYHRWRKEYGELIVLS